MVKKAIFYKKIESVEVYESRVFIEVQETFLDNITK